VSETVSLLVFVVGLSVLMWGAISVDNRLKALSAIWLVFFLVSAPAISHEWARMTSELVTEEGDSHHGLPDLWDGQQVVCIHFPNNSTHPDYSDGRHHIDYDGTDFMTDDESSATGACVGGFSGYENGFDLMLNATNTAEGDLEVAYSTSEYGIMIETIGGIDPCSSYTCSSTQGAYWSLYHNNAWSMVGIGELVLQDDSVIVWQVDTW